MRSYEKTIFCVVIAGLLFIPSVIFNLKVLWVIGAIFDWLPLPTGWMKFERKIGSDVLKWVKIHVILTVAAYAIALLWIFGGWNSLFARFLFLEVWWLAVIAGVVLTSRAHGQQRD